MTHSSFERTFKKIIERAGPKARPLLEASMQRQHPHVAMMKKVLGGLKKVSQ
jgi:hypothetical protein